ncbi:glycosyltransferase [Leuconostoc lactis]|uniref:glycosyltransferase n=1 Tax=Leuconostoc lactis TaxID=1246 RepID=UPI0015577EC4|nr:glycosyltransferase [Leuconostoc lactis]
MKILYYTPEMSFAPGIQKKIDQQVLAFEDNGFSVDLRAYTTDVKSVSGIFSAVMPWGKVRRELDYSLKSDYDVEYYRRPRVSFDQGFIEFLEDRQKKNPNAIRLLEIPTFPYDQERSGIIGKTMLFKDRIWRKKLKKFFSAIVTYSDDKEIFGLPTINVSNGINFNSIKIKRTRFRTIDDNKINLIAVASLEKWHGYDRVIHGMHNYYLNKNIESPEVNMYIVGSGKPKIEKALHKLVDEYQLNSHIFFTGKKMGKELDDLFEDSDIAIDSLGRHRSNVFYNSSLKGKEYIARGLPSISGVRTELDNESNFPFYFRVPADETPVNIQEIVDFYYKIVLQETNVSKKIRDFGQTKFDMNTAVQPIIDYILLNRKRDEKQ